MIDNAKYSILGVILEEGKIIIEEATGVVGVLISKNNDVTATKDKLIVEAYASNNVIIAQKEYELTSNTIKGTQNIDLGQVLPFLNASYLKAYIKNDNDIIISLVSDKIIQGSYKGLPIIGDWITNAVLGNGPDVLSPAKVPAGIDPALVDTKKLNVTYSYDEAKYPKIETDNMLWYRTGAYNPKSTIYDRDGADWEQQALPIGNGYMGGMIFGMPGKDHIQFNEETFWAAGYRGVQEAVEPTYINRSMSEHINGYMNAGNIFVDFNLPENPTITNYYRDLNLDEAVAHVQYEYNKVKYKREYFASYPAQVLVFRYTADTKGALNFTVNPVSAHPGSFIVKDGEITIIGNLKDSEPYSGGGKATYNQKSDLEYCTKVKVIADDGKVIENYANVGVQDATGVTVIVTAATDYDPNQFAVGEDGKVDINGKQYKSLQGVKYAIDKAANRITNTTGKTYGELKAEHISDYQKLFNRVKFSLTDNDEICQIPTDELQASFRNVIPNISAGQKVTFEQAAYNKLDKHLEELHYNFARYLMISSSRENTTPANLQGKWNPSVAEIWGSCYCININMEMNYWFVGGANLLESGKALIGWFNSQIPAGKITSKNMYEIGPKSYVLNGNTITFSDAKDAEKDDVFIMHTKQSINGQTDMTGTINIQSAGNTAWLMYNLWDLYCCSGDKELLARDIYPIMRKAANFYTQYMYGHKRITEDTVKYPKGYYYTTGIGCSPEQGPVQEGIKYDLQLVAGMFDYTIAAAETLEIDSDKVAVWKEIRNNMEAPVELGADGQIKEWAQEVGYNTDNEGKAIGDPSHRHISQLVALYPGNLINREAPELLKGAKITLENRGDEATGWSTSNKFLMWSRVLDGDKALQLFRFQLAQKTYGNLFDFHAPFQIDGNFGSAAAVMELLMQSQTGTICLLPALPKQWYKGFITGLRAKTGAEVDIIWANSKLTVASITPVVDGDLRLYYDFSTELIVTAAYKKVVLSITDGIYTIVNGKAGITYVVTPV